MPDAVTSVEIPNRALFKAAEVCDLVKLQPYVLRSWEAEFPELGVAKSEGGPRVYRRNDVEQVVRIKHLLLVEGLTLAGARRKLQEEAAPVAADAPVIDELIDKIIAADSRTSLTTACKVLDRLIRTGRYWIPHWYKASHWLAYWDVFGRPATKPRYARGIPETWWYDREKAVNIDQ